MFFISKTSLFYRLSLICSLASEDINQRDRIELTVLQVYANAPDWDGYGPLPPEPTDEDQYTEGVARGHWDKRLTSFQKLMFIKSFQEERVSAFSVCRSVSLSLSLSLPPSLSLSVFCVETLMYNVSLTHLCI